MKDKLLKQFSVRTLWTRPRPFGPRSLPGKNNRSLLLTQMRNVLVVYLFVFNVTAYSQSKVPWRSGGSRDTNFQSSTKEWAKARRRECTFQVVYSSRSSGWPSFVSSHGTNGQIANFTDTTIEVMIQTSPFPEGGTYTDLVDGSYDKYWQQIGKLVKQRVASGRPTIISIAWEMNGTYMFWAGGEGKAKYARPEQYIAGYQRIVNQLRTAYPEVRTAWIINAHATPASIGTTDPWKLYPGDEFVTYVGIDNYDHYPPALSKQAFDEAARATGGLYWLADLAAKHGKQIIVGEWGINNSPQDVADGRGGGDNPNFIQWMFETFQSWHASGRLYAEYYFADPCGEGNVDSDLIGCNPASRSKYVELYEKP